MEKKMYKVTNKTKGVKKFRDKFIGKDILVEPKKFVITNRPPMENDVWKIDDIEKLEKEKKLNNTGGKKMIDKKHDSSSN